jgi:hypothetical protein
MVNAIVNGLKREGYEVNIAVPDVEQLSKIKNRPKFWILYLNEKTEDISKALVYINDAISEEELRFFVVCSDEQKLMVENVIPESKVTRFFKQIHCPHYLIITTLIIHLVNHADKFSCTLALLSIFPVLRELMFLVFVEIVD